MTYDESNKADPYALTPLLTDRAFASRIVLFSSSNFTGNRATMLGILDAMKDQRDSGIELKREHIVGATKYLNRMGAITLLDSLGRERVHSIISDYYATEQFANFKLK